MSGRVIVGPYRPDLIIKGIYQEVRDGNEENGVQLMHGPLAFIDKTANWSEASRPWPRGVVGLLATTNTLKTEETDRPLRHHDFRIVPHTVPFGETVDSLEDQSNAIHIARMKVKLSIQDEWDA